MRAFRTSGKNVATNMKDIFERLEAIIYGADAEQRDAFFERLNEGTTLDGVKAALDDMGIELADEQVAELDELYGMAIRELQDEELENVNGGSVYEPDDVGGELITTSCNKCAGFLWDPGKRASGNKKICCRNCANSYVRSELTLGNRQMRIDTLLCKIRKRNNDPYK